MFFFSSKRRHTSCALVTGVQTCALPILRVPEWTPPGEYRAHMLFRAVPDAAPAAEPKPIGGSGVSIALTPIYGITIPVIVRVGDLAATAEIGAARVAETADGAAFEFDLTRSGARSV